MSLKKLSALMLCCLLVVLAGCSQKTNSTKKPSSDAASAKPAPEPVVYINPLTGEENFDKDKLNTRPVAIMINNINIAQKVQCGLHEADIIYETEVEGGITRLLAVFADVSSAGRIGTIRSARYPYIDIAMGHNAVYCHHGQDPTYAAPHLKDCDHVTIDTNNAGTRISNGLATEHTLYTHGDKLAAWLESNRKMENSSSGNWQSFVAPDETVTLDGGACNKLTVPFSNSQKTVFTYDAANGNYLVQSNGNIKTDYVSGNTVSVKNIFVLKTSISYYPDNYHRKVDLSSGEGYYITNGTYTAINWSKGDASDPFKFTNTDGSELTVSAGNSWICLPDKIKSNPVIE